MSHWSLKLKLLLILLVPTTASLILATGQVVDRQRELTAVDHFQSLALLAVKTGTAIHALQTERSMSVAYLASHGKLFADDLPAQQAQTTDALNDMHQWDSREDLQSTALDTFSQSVVSLSTIRGQILQPQNGHQREVEIADVISDYSQSIQNAISVIASVEQVALTPTLTRATTAYMDLLQTKEFNSQEASQLFRTLRLNHFPDDSPFQDYLTLIARTEAATDAFQLHAANKYERMFSETITEQSAQQTLQNIREKVMALGDHAYYGSSPMVWLDAADEHSRQLKTLEDTYTQDFLTLVDSVKETATTALWQAIIIGYGLPLLGLCLTWALAMNMQQRVTRILQAAQRLTCRDLSLGLSSRQPEQDELGQIEMALDELRTNWREAVVSIQQQCASLSRYTLQVTSDAGLGADHPDGELVTQALHSVTSGPESTGTLLACMAVTQDELKHLVADYTL